mgnify:FL=1
MGVMKLKSVGFILLATILIWSCAEQDAKSNDSNADKAIKHSGEVNVYSHRYYDSDKELFKRFEEETGIVVNIKMDDADRLIQLIQAEGENSPADLLITTDIGRLVYAQDLGLLDYADSKTLIERIPSHLRDSDNEWFGLTKRARVIMYNTDLVDPSELSTYEDLATDKWKGQISVRSSTNIYNRSLLSSIIAHHKIEQATEWAASVRDNMATDPKGNDRDQLKNIVSGTGKIALTNTYYLGLMLNSENEAERAAAAKILPFFPNQDGRGAHVNISGAGVVKGASNKTNAIKLLEYLVSVDAQSLYVEANYEYPVNPNVPMSELLASWGEFEEDTLDLEVVGRLQADAIVVFEAAEWD